MAVPAQRLSFLRSRIWNIRVLVISFRPGDWIKNTFVFSALFFSKNLLNLDLLAQTFLAFGLFCLTASGVYLINDILDRNQDRNHPLKCKRPIASGELAVETAAYAAGFLLLIALGGAFLMRPGFGFITAGYIVLTFSYSRWLKHAVILDVFSIAAGFVLRVLAGGAVANVSVSHWLLICTSLLALFLGFGKRRYEVVALGNGGGLHRRVLEEYNPLFLDMMIGIVTSATIVAYILYTISPETVQKFQTDRLVITIPFVLYGIFRYLYLIYHKHSGGVPSQLLIKDKPLLINILIWAGTSALIIYVAAL